MTGSNGEARRTFLLAAIADTEGTIRATDTKASIALVLHGLLFSSLLGVTKSLGDTYHNAGCEVKTAIVVLLIAGGGAFAGSIVQLLRCVRPAPKAAIPVLDQGVTTGHFFLPFTAGRLRGTSPMLDFETLRGQIAGLDEAAMEEELTGELVKVSAIRARKTALVSSGLLLLGLELVAATAYLTLLGIAAG